MGRVLSVRYPAAARAVSALIAQARVPPFVDRAKVIDPAGIRYVVTDRNDEIRAPLWRPDGSGTIKHSPFGKQQTIQLGGRRRRPDPNGSKANIIWLGGLKTDFPIINGHGQPSTLSPRRLALDRRPSPEPVNIALHWGTLPVAVTLC